MRPGRRPAAAGALALLALAPFLATLLPSYWIFLATTAAIDAIVIRSLGVVTGQAGMISLSQLSFAAIGAWTVARLNLHGMPVPFPLAVLAGGLAAVPFGALVGLPALRLRGVNLAVVTLGFATAADVWFAKQGFPGADISGPVVLDAPLDDPGTYFALCWGCFLAIAAALGLVGRSRVGAGWLAVRDSERATAAMGISVPRAKLGAFAVSAGIAGLAGGLVAGQLAIVTPPEFQPLGSLSIFALAVMVGARFPEGAALGGVLSAFTPEVLRRLHVPLDFGDMLFALGAVVVLRAGGGGVAEQVRGHLRRLRRAPEAARATGDGEAPQPPRRASQAPALDVRGLTVRFGSLEALHAVDLRVPRGAVCGLIGPNGAGKSTLVDAVTGFQRRYEGSIDVGGTSVDRLGVLRRARAGVRRTFQHDRTIDELTAGEYVRLAARRRLGSRELDELLAFFDCPPAGTPIAAIDVGGRRLIEVAGVLGARPEIALLDEPAAGLAEAESQQLAARLAEVPERFGCSLLLIEHDMAHVRTASSTVVALGAGEVIAQGTPREVLEHRDVMATYLGTDPLLG